MKPATDVPIWEQYTMTVEEAAAYFRVGEGKLCRLISEDKNADFILWNGNRAQIKRKKFEEFIDKCNELRSSKDQFHPRKQQKTFAPGKGTSYCFPCPGRLRREIRFTDDG